MKLDGDRIIGMVLIAIPFVCNLIITTDLMKTSETISLGLLAIVFIGAGLYLLTTKK